MASKRGGPIGAVLGTRMPLPTVRRSLPASPRAAASPCVLFPGPRAYSAPREPSLTRGYHAPRSPSPAHGCPAPKVAVPWPFLLRPEVAPTGILCFIVGKGGLVVDWCTGKRKNQELNMWCF
jgi:hypothetical protein